MMAAMAYALCVLRIISRDGIFFSPEIIVLLNNRI